MPKVTNTGSGAVRIPAARLTLAPGATAEIASEIADGLGHRHLSVAGSAKRKADEVLEAVGDDAAAAAAALADELAQTKPRKGLVTKLEAIADEAAASTVADNGADQEEG